MSRLWQAGDRFNAEQKRLGGDRAGRASRLAQERLRDIRKLGFVARLLAQCVANSLYINCVDREYQSAIADFEGSVKELHEEWKNCCVVCCCLRCYCLYFLCSSNSSLLEEIARSGRAAY
jgi:hypothetical protein